MRCRERRSSWVELSTRGSFGLISGCIPRLSSTLRLAQSRYFECNRILVSLPRTRRYSRVKTPWFEWMLAIIFQRCINVLYYCERSLTPPLPLVGREDDDDDEDGGAVGRKLVTLLLRCFANSRVAIVNCPTPSRIFGANPCSREIALTSLAKRMTVYHDESAHPRHEN